MPNIDIPRQLRRDDFSPRVSEDLVYLATEYGKGLDALDFLVGGRLDYTNLSVIIQTVSFTTRSDYSSLGWDDIEIPNTLGRKATEVRKARCIVDTSNFTPIGSAVDVEWEESAGRIMIKYVNGLSDSTDYKLTVIIA